ncbi:MAG: ferritin-like domain-containing protein [Gammaproteobacteria bacterium]|nr:ferritin-like domain-containing protein [Gammaproteobacteria bacterium]
MAVVSIFNLANSCLVSDTVDEKIRLTQHAWQAISEDQVSFDCANRHPVPLEAGRPLKPDLVETFQVPKRSMTSDQNHPAFVHALAHIEFNAVNLAWDAVCRFTDMPKDFYRDWARVAAEEAYHFSLLREYLVSLGYDYGDFEAHSGLWQMAILTADDVMQRMALVPRVLEARGLDVTPGMIDKLRHHKRDRLADILDIIYRDEIGHVEIGTRWFNVLCETRGLDAQQTFEELIERFAQEKIRAPINVQGRKQAGFTQAEIDYLYSCI